MKRFVIAVCVLCAHFQLFAECTVDSVYVLQRETDSLVTDISQAEADKHRAQLKLRAAHVYYGVVTGFYGLTIKHDHGGAPSSADYRSAFCCKADNVLQFAPLATSYALKLAGVESRNSWKKMIVSNALAIGLSRGAAMAIKNGVDSPRPNGEDNNSFPSGHTVMAFTSATILSNEYAWNKPWIGVGGYACATLTALMRRTNDKHWYRDLSMGAGIGILSTEIAYFVTDLMFPEKHGAKSPMQKADLTHFRPSFANSFMGMSYINSTFDVQGKEVKFKKGNKGGLESAYFFNPYIGAGGQIYVTTNRVMVNNEYQDHSFDCAVIGVGPYFSVPVTKNFLVGANATANYTAYPNCDLNTIDYRLGGRDGIGYSVGGSLSWLLPTLKQNIRLYCAYAQLPEATAESNSKIKTFSYGIGFSKMFNISK